MYIYKGVFLIFSTQPHERYAPCKLMHGKVLIRLHVSNSMTKDTLWTFEADAMSIQVQESSQVLLNAHELHQRELGPCAVLELQFQPYPESLGCVSCLFWEGQEAF